MAVRAATLRGFVRVQLVDTDTGQIVGDSQWTENQVTSTGISAIINQMISGITNGVPTHLVLSSKTDSIASSDNTIAGEYPSRKNSSVSSLSPGTRRLTASFASNENTSPPAQIGSIACFSATSTGTMFGAATFSSSSWVSNQNVLMTYELRLFNT